MIMHPPHAWTTGRLETLSAWDAPGFFAQPLLQGKCAIIYQKGRTSAYAKTFLRPIITTNFDLPDGIYAGCIREGKIVVYDILRDGEDTLWGMSAMDRMALLEKLIPANEYDGPISWANETVGIAACWKDKFCDQFFQTAVHPWMRGIVVKKRDTPLRHPFSDLANTEGQIKFYKP
jgi:hypothetical protein